MKVCKTCNGHGCEQCDFLGLEVDLTFDKKKRNSRRLSYDEYQKKKERNFKIDKKNAREVF